MTERSKLLRRVQICEFALAEAALYLDAYPNNMEALKYYRKYAELGKKAVAEYEDKFGPLTQGANMNENEWQWINNPWPWESEG